MTDLYMDFVNLVLGGSKSSKENHESKSDVEIYNEQFTSYYDVLCVLQNWQRTQEIDSDIPKELFTIVGFYRGYETPWSSHFHGSHMDIAIDRSDRIVYTHNRGTHAWAGNTIRSQYPLPNHGVSEIHFMFRFSDTPERTRLRSGYFIGVIRGAKRRMRNPANIAADDIAMMGEFSKRTNYNISVTEKKRKKNKMRKIYGLANKIDQCYAVNGSVFDDGYSALDRISAFEANQKITMTIDYRTYQLSFALGGWPITENFQYPEPLSEPDEEDEPEHMPAPAPQQARPFAIQLDPREALRYYWYPTVSIWHAGVTCEILFE